MPRKTHKLVMIMARWGVHYRHLNFIFCGVVCKMSQTELLAMARQGPIRIRMNDGRAYEIPNRDHITVGPRTAAVLHKNDDGEMSIMILSLPNMTSAEPITGESAG